MVRKPYKGIWTVLSPSGEMVSEAVVEDWANADHRLPAEIKAAQAAYPLGSGAQLCWSYEAPPGTQWSRKARARNRQRRLRRRLLNKYPMFADQFYARELEKRPLYFTARHPFYDAGRPSGPPATS